MNTWQVLGNLSAEEKIPNFNLIFFKYTKAYQIKYNLLTYHDNNSHFWFVLSSWTAVRFCYVIENNPGWISPAWIIRQYYGILFRNEAEISVSLYFSFFSLPVCLTCSAEFRSLFLSSTFVLPNDWTSFLPF
jgi:hypothetical protein